jgi:hypothetical protein
LFANTKHDSGVYPWKVRQTLSFVELPLLDLVLIMSHNWGMSDGRVVSGEMVNGFGQGKVLGLLIPY